MILLWLGVCLSVVPVLGSKYKKGGGKPHSQIDLLSGLDAQSEKQRSSDHATILAESQSQYMKISDSEAGPKGGGEGEGGGKDSCTLASACGDQCATCRECFENAVGDFNTYVLSIQNGNLSGVSSEYQKCHALNKTRSNNSAIGRCFNLFPTCSSYFLCIKGKPLIDQICPAFVIQQCQECRNAIASQASVTANVDLHGENEIASEGALIQGSNMEKLGLEDDLDSVYQRKRCR